MKTFTLYAFISNILILNSVQCLEIKPEEVKKNAKLCNKIAKDPYFESELVVGKPWRIYYTWNMKLDSKCIDLVFKNATPKIIRRIRTDMYDYMEQQPYWDSAALVMTTGAAHHEMLMFPAQGVAGCFLAVPNVIRHGDITPMRNGVPLLKFQLKLIRDSKYLVIIDCHTSLSSLSARSSFPRYRSEVATAVAELDLGDGFPACTKERNKEERFFVK